MIDENHLTFKYIGDLVTQTQITNITHSLSQNKHTRTLSSEHALFLSINPSTSCNTCEPR